MKPAAKRPPNDRGQGRKPLPEDQRAVVGSVRLTPAEWEKFKALGGVDWLRGAIKRARTKP
jgi:hypothetical protein